MKNQDDIWLNNILDAALDKQSKPATLPDFNAIRQAAQANSIKKQTFVPQHKKILAAAIIAVILAAVPATLFGYRALERKRAVCEENLLLAEQVIGGTIFEEDLLIDTPWPFEDADTENFFDI